MAGGSLFPVVQRVVLGIVLYEIVQQFALLRLAFVQACVVQYRGVGGRLVDTDSRQSRTVEQDRCVGASAARWLALWNCRKRTHSG